MRYEELSAPELRLREFCKHHLRHPTAAEYSQRVLHDPRKLIAPNPTNIRKARPAARKGKKGKRG